MKAKQALLSLFIIISAALFISGCDRQLPKEKRVYDPKIDPNDYVDTVNNKYFTLIPGRTFVYEGQTDEGKERIEVKTLNERKKVMEVRTVVVHDRVWLNGELIEDTKDWFAQDKDGNVWYFGEDSKEYENAKVKSTEGSWEAGVDGAEPGIIMKAHPKIGQAYRQEYYKGVAEDMGEVLSLDNVVSVPFGKFDNCLKTKDWTPLEPGVFENKYYSSVVGGVVLEENVKSGERVELIEIRMENK